MQIVIWYKCITNIGPNIRVVMLTYYVDDITYANSHLVQMYNKYRTKYKGRNVNILC